MKKLLLSKIEKLNNPKNVIGFFAAILALLLSIHGFAGDSYQKKTDLINVKPSCLMEHFDLLLKTQDTTGCDIAYYHLPGTNLLLNEFSAENGHVNKRIFYFFDRDGIWVKAIEDAETYGKDLSQGALGLPDLPGALGLPDLPELQDLAAQVLLAQQALQGHLALQVQQALRERPVLQGRPEQQGLAVQAQQAPDLMPS